jgi:aminodeoxyfutalosine synthase
MATSETFDRHIAHIDVGERLAAEDIRALAATADVLPLGMLADHLRRRIHDTRVTYVRVATCRFDQSLADAVPPSAREIRIGGAPESVSVATVAIGQAKAIAGERTVSAFSWGDVERLAEHGGQRVSDVLHAWRDAGLDAVADLPIDLMTEPAVAIDRLTSAGFQQLSLSIAKASAEQRIDLLLRVAQLQDEFACIQAIDPLPTILNPLRPTTGYQDVKMVAVARLAAANVPTIQVDWARYGPKLAQVALTFGADDLYGISASDEAPEGRRRAALEEIRRNIEAAGFEATERDGHFTVVP